MSKMERARKLLADASAAGHIASIEGNWVVFRPPLTFDQLMESSDLGDALTMAINNPPEKAP